MVNEMTEPGTYKDADEETIGEAGRKRESLLVQKMSAIRIAALRLNAEAKAAAQRQAAATGQSTCGVEVMRVALWMVAEGAAWDAVESRVAAHPRGRLLDDAVSVAECVKLFVEAYREKYSTTELVVIAAIRAPINEKGERVDCGDLFAHLSAAIEQYLPGEDVPNPQFELGGDVFFSPLADARLIAGYPLSSDWLAADLREHEDEEDESH